MAEEKKETVIVGSFDITNNMPSQNGGQLVLHGYLYAGDHTAEINARIDQLQDVAKRQFERQGIELRMAEREKHVDNLRRIRELYDALVEKKQNGVKLKTQEEQQFQAGAKTIEAALAQIKAIEDGIAESKRKFGLA
jgi:hypothetical protein